MGNIVAQVKSKEKVHIKCPLDLTSFSWASLTKTVHKKLPLNYKKICSQSHSIVFQNNDYVEKEKKRWTKGSNQRKEPTMAVHLCIGFPFLSPTKHMNYVCMHAHTCSHYLSSITFH